MKWQEVREKYPNKFVKMKMLEYHFMKNYKIVDEVKLIKVIENNIEATHEIINCKNNVLVYHTSHESIAIELKTIRRINFICR